jgi:hypothetical protein
MVRRSTARLPALLTFVAIASLAASPDSSRADGEVGNSAAIGDLDAGFRAIDMIADLKRAHDQRLADCRAATGDERLCNCINSRLTLDLTYPEYLALSTGNAAATVATGKRIHGGEAKQVRATCTGNP